VTTFCRAKPSVRVARAATASVLTVQTSASQHQFEKSIYRPFADLVLPWSNWVASDFERLIILLGSPRGSILDRKF
jgi:hypothetical protein